MNEEQRDGRVCGQNYRLLVRGCGFRHIDINGKLGGSYREVYMACDLTINTSRTGLLNCLNARSRGLTFRHRASCI